MTIVMLGLNKYIRKTEKQKARLKVRASDFVRSTVKRVLRDLVLQTPQWSGNTAASWTIVTNQSNTASPYSALYESEWQDVEPRFKGDKEALRVAMSVNAPLLAKLRWNSQIKIVNMAPMADELATDSGIEGGLRPGNFIPGDVMAIATVSRKYKLFSNVEGVRLLRGFDNVS